MEVTILELVEICRQKELLCMHDNVDDLIESALNSKLLSINSQLTPILSTKEPGYSPGMGYEHPNTTLKTELDEIINSGVEELEPILIENEVTSKDKKECVVPVCENYPVCDNHSYIFSYSKNDDDISSDDHDFEDIKYVEASLSDPEIVSVEEENIIFRPNSKLFAIIQKRREVVTPLLMLMTLFSSMIHFALRLSPIRREGDIRFLEALLIDDSIPFPNNDSFESDFDNLSFPRPPPKPLNAEFDVETDSGKEISVVMNDIVEFECLDPRVGFDDENDDYSSFMIVICSKMFLSFLSAESEDTIFDPGISV
nr:hypothetical protein [Tanacetum cinerariifolium]